MSESKKIKVRVYHAYYGCETGCCGHVVTLGEDYKKERFEFSHLYDEGKQTMQEWVRNFAERVIKKEWPECFNSIDWDSLQWDECSNE